MKLATSVTTSATTASTSALAAYTTGRRGIAQSDVRIIPVEYSEVNVIAPSTTMTSWPRKNSPARLVWVASKVAWSPGDIWFQCDAVAAEIAPPRPMLTASSTSSVQYVDRTERILVHSESSAPRSPDRPVAGGSAVVVMAAISVPPRPGGNRRVVFHAVPGQFHERRLQRGPDHGEFVQPHPGVERDVPDMLSVQPLHGKFPVGAA